MIFLRTPQLTPRLNSNHASRRASQNAGRKGRRSTGRSVAAAILASAALLTSCAGMQDSGTETDNAAASTPSASSSGPAGSDTSIPTDASPDGSTQPTSTSEDSAAESADSDAGAAAGSGNGSDTGFGKDGNCTPDPNAQAVTDAVARVNQDYPNKFGGWTYKGDSNYDTCSVLTYALAEQSQQGNAQFQTIIMMFHRGEYLGIDSIYPQQASDIEPTNIGFDVTYKDWEALQDSREANAAAPKYTQRVLFYWNGERAAYKGYIPNSGLGSK